MDAESKSVTEFLIALERVRSELGQFVDDMRDRDGVIQAKPFLLLGGSPFRVHNGDKTEEYVSAVCVGASVKHSNGNELSWSVDIYWDAHRWFVQSSIEIGRDETSETVKKLETRTAVTLDECVEALKLASSELRKHGDALNLLQR